MWRSSASNVCDCTLLSDNRYPNKTCAVWSVQVPELALRLPHKNRHFGANCFSIAYEKWHCIVTAIAGVTRTFDFAFARENKSVQFGDKRVRGDGG